MDAKNGEFEETYSTRIRYACSNPYYIIIEDLSEHFVRVLRTFGPHVTHGTSMNRLYADHGGSNNQIEPFLPRNL